MRSNRILGTILKGILMNQASMDLDLLGCEGAITSFDGEYRFLSNFDYALVTYDSVTYPTLENAYVASKTTDKALRVQFEDMRPGKAKRLGYGLPIRAGWDEMKLDVMWNLLLQKFAPGSEHAEKLLATGDRLLIEGNNHGDTYYGVCKGVGFNHLGKMLMRIRQLLRDQL